MVEPVESPVIAKRSEAIQRPVIDCFATARNDARHARNDAPRSTPQAYNVNNPV